MEKDFSFSLVDDIRNDGNALLLITRYGSHLYGTATEDSDEDYAILYAPPLGDILLGTERHSYRYNSNADGKNHAGDVDIQASSVNGVVKRFMKGELVALDLLHAPTNPHALIYIHPAFMQFLEGYIWNHRLTPVRMAGVLGYMRNQANKYGMKGTKLGVALELDRAVNRLIERYGGDTLISAVANDIPVNKPHVQWAWMDALGKGGSHKKVRALNVFGRFAPEYWTLDQLSVAVRRVVDGYGHRSLKAMEQEGVDYKALSHALRAAHEYEAYIGGHLRFPLPPNVVDTVRAIKEGRMDFAQAKAVVEAAVDRVMRLHEARQADNEAVEENYALAKQALKNLYAALWG